ncbi:specifically androgen-regulated gene protein [Antennarius striatus]|uniref:specifically androgen-regulated gene protein n=1 Tax=Antennarius striatus TaxID=241820 RepID=UPI0035AEBC3C
MASMNSAGSCDSVVSANSGFSKDSLEHLSAEEKACLMFLEETIESLDTEEDSGLSNDEPDQLPNPGNIATKLADLSASISKSKLNNTQKHASKELRQEKMEPNPSQRYLIPTPLIVASSSSYSVPSVKLGALPYKNTLKPDFIPINEEPGRKHNLKPTVSSKLPSKIPLEGNVVIPSPVKTPEGPLPRGPLSYDALVHLRSSASTKKTPLCPTIDHTIDLDKNLLVTIGALNTSSYSSKSEACQRSHPVVAPKPKKIPANMPSLAKNTSYTIKNAADPQVIRMDALQKLGLLKDSQPENENVTPLPPPEFCPSVDTITKRTTGGHSNVNPLRIPSFSYTQVPIEPKKKPLHSSASLHHYAKHNHHSNSTSYPSQFNRLKAARLECAATPDSHKNGGNCPEPQRIIAAKPERTTTAAQAVPHNPSNSVGYTVMVVPGMGADRKEALRKLGLLKN